MKTQIKLKTYRQYIHTANTLLLVCLLLVVLMFAFITARAGEKQPAIKADDSKLPTEIARQLASGRLGLHYPLTLKRYYTQKQFNANWVGAGVNADQTWAAMLMIDCVLQYGLNHADYHPAELLYDKLHDILERPEQVPVTQAARFELMLTDAMITFINNAHFGKYNPLFAQEKIDAGGLPFDAVDILNKAVLSEDLTAVIVTAQPQNKQYQNLQSRMHTVGGVQLGDCYEFPEADVRKMALNMERLRWAALDTDNYIQVNVPSFKLSFYHNAAIDTFRVIVGKQGNPTPTLSSNITYFTTAPEWKVPQSIFVKELLPKAIKDPAYLDNNHLSIYNNDGMLIKPNKIYLLKIKQSPKRYYATQSAGCDNALGQLVFRFANIYDVYLHDTPEPDLFFNNIRAYSHGCIRVQNPTRLARLLLTNDNAQASIPAMQNAIDKGVRKNFTLKKPLPIAITYITCEMVNGTLVVYNDVYDMDKSLDMLMYTQNDATLKISQVNTH